MARTTGLNEKIKFGEKHKDKTPKEVIDEGDGQYLDYVFDNTGRKFCRETWTYLEEYRKNNSKKV